MTTRRSMALCGALAAVLLASATADVRADRESGKSRLYDTRGPRTFAISVEHTGRVGDDMVIEGVRYRMSRNLSVYFVDRGPQPQGVSVSKSLLYLAGEMRGGDAIVSTAIVRPAPTSTDGPDRSMHVRVQPAGVPK